MDKIRKHFIFHGEVQGVGFRWNALHTARKYGVSGWARNLYDGTVEMEAEGTPLDIAALVDELKNARWVNVTDMDVRTIPLQGGYGFEIK
jgi:acylphosphatase